MLNMSHSPPAATEPHEANAEPAATACQVDTLRVIPLGHVRVGGHGSNLPLANAMWSRCPASARPRESSTGDRHPQTHSVDHLCPL